MLRHKQSKEERFQEAEKLIYAFWADQIFPNVAETKSKLRDLGLGKEQIQDLRDSLPSVNTGTTAERVQHANRLLKRLTQ
jgi:hypothetical protein